MSQVLANSDNVAMVSVANMLGNQNMYDYLKKFGFTGEQAYLLLSCAPVEGRLSGVVDIPNACCTLALPTAIFDKNILPT